MSPVITRAQAILAERQSGQHGSSNLQGSAIFVKLPPLADAQAVETQILYTVERLVPALGFNPAREVQVGREE